MSNLVNKVQSCLDNLVVAPGDFNTCQLAEVRQVGCYKKGTLLAGNNVAEIVVILKTLPTKEACSALSRKVQADVTKPEPEALAKADSYTVAEHDRGFDICTGEAKVCVFITTLPVNMRKLEAGTHLDPDTMQDHLTAIRHSRWFEENAHHSSIKVLIRLLRDICTRFPGLSSLSQWMLDLLAHLVVMRNNCRQALPIHVAFRRVFQLLASGLFLPGSAGITDPCEKGQVRVHTNLTLEQQDEVCMAAQTIQRILCQGGWNFVLGLEAGDIDGMSVWNGVSVAPQQVVFVRPKAEQGDEKSPEPVDEPAA